MKKIFRLFVIAAAAAGLLASCEKSAISPLSGEYPAADQLKGVTFTDGGRTSEDGFYVFSVKGQNLDLYFAGRSWYLGEGSYNYSEVPAGNALLARSSVNGKAIVRGGLTVYKKGDDYEIDGTVWLSDNEPVQIKSHGTLIYEEVIVTPKFYYTLSDYEDNGVKRGYNLSLTDLQGASAANFLLISNSGVTGTYAIGDPNAGDNGIASYGVDLSALFGQPAGSFVLGSYFFEDGKQWLLTAGSVEVSGDENMYTVVVSNLVAAALDGTPYSGDTKTFENAVKSAPVEPVTLTLEGWSAVYSFKDNADAGIREHKLALKDSFGGEAGQILVTTTLLGGINGTFEAATDAEKIDRYTAGADLSIFGMGWIGSYFSVFGTGFPINGGTMTISSGAETVSVSVEGLTGIDGVNGLSLPAMALTIAQPEDPHPPVPGDETFTLEGCTYTLVSAPKEGVDGVTEHTFTFKDASDNVVAQYVEWTATDAAITGSFSWAATTETAIGSFAGGYDFFGMAIFGSYYVREGGSYLINGGSAEVSESGGKLSVKITGLVSATAAGEAGTETILEIKDAVNADAPVEKETFLVENGTYTVTSLPKEGVDGVTEHTFTFKDVEGNLVGSYVEWTATDAAYTGFFTYAEPTATAIGSFAGGLDFFGMMTLGTYYFREGVEYLVNAGTSIVAEEDGKLSVIISDLGSAAKDATAGTAEILYFKDFTKAE